MGRKTENSGFDCINCGAPVAPVKKGTIRNHCPLCLHSLHVDVNIGDRQSLCSGLMAPGGMEQHSQKGWQILHVCVKCGFKRKNMLADDDCIEAVVRAMNRPAH